LNQNIVTRATVEQVLTGTTDEHIIASAAQKRVVAISADIVLFALSPFTVSVPELAVKNALTVGVILSPSVSDTMARPSPGRRGSLAFIQRNLLRNHFVKVRRDIGASFFVQIVQKHWFPKPLLETPENP
jgi:hypothetical protein